MRLGWIRPSPISSSRVSRADLAADRVEAAEQHRLGGVVDDQVDPGDLLEGADVAALAADDPALHVVGRAAAPTETTLSPVCSEASRWIAVASIRWARVLGLLLGGPLDVAGEQRAGAAWRRARCDSTSSARASSAVSPASRSRTRRRSLRPPRAATSALPALPGPAALARRAAARARSAGARAARCPGAARAGPRAGASSSRGPVRRTEQQRHHAEDETDHERRRQTSRSTSAAADPGEGNGR